MQIRRTAAALTSAAALSITGVAMATPAQAANQVANGLVNVQIGDITIEDVNIAVAAAIAATACDLVDVTNVAILAANTDQNSRTSTVCTTDGGKVRFTQG